MKKKINVNLYHMLLKEIVLKLLMKIIFMNYNVVYVKKILLVLKLILFVWIKMNFHKHLIKIWILLNIVKNMNFKIIKVNVYIVKKDFI